MSVPRSFRPIRAALAALLLLIPVLGCGPGSDEIAGPPEPASREIEAAGALGNFEVVALILRMLDRPERGEALARYGEIRLVALSDGNEAAVPKAFDFLDRMLGWLEDGEVGAPDVGKTPAQGVARMFAAIFAELGLPGFPLDADAIEDGDYAVGFVGPGGGTVTVPSHHAAISFDPGQLTGPTGIVIQRLPDRRFAGRCPDGFPQGVVDCYPLFYDFALFPASNLTGIPRIGQCVVESGPLAPSATVEARLRLASPSHSNPGAVDFWPLATAPSSVQCDDLAWGGAEGWWAALDPVWTLFSPDPLYAAPGRLGASVSTFSPFAPADPGPRGPQSNGAIDVTVENAQGAPQVGALVQLFQGQTQVASTFTDSDGRATFSNLPVDAAGTGYVVAASNSFGQSDSDVVTLTPQDPTADVLLVLQGFVFTDGGEPPDEPLPPVEEEPEEEPQEPSTRTGWNGWLTIWN